MILDWYFTLGFNHYKNHSKYVSFLSKLKYAFTNLIKQTCVHCKITVIINTNLSRYISQPFKFSWFILEVELNLACFWLASFSAFKNGMDNVCFNNLLNKCFYQFPVISGCWSSFMRNIIQKGLPYKICWIDWTGTVHPKIIISVWSISTFS